MQYFEREIKVSVKKALESFPVVAILGPRQSGKTTFIKNTFTDYEYVNLEDPESRLFAKDDPKGFFLNYSKNLIIDEAQKVPELFSYIQIEVDKPDNNRKIILSGSQNFLLHQEITQSLAGRIALFTLLPYSISEIKQEQIIDENPKYSIFKGFYPRIISQNFEPTLWYKNYVSTYIEKDVRDIKNISDLDTFQKFIKICASNIGQIFNANQIANNLGISANTVKDWLGILESSYIVFRLQPYFTNIKKRLIKSPKLYFHDVGLASYLLDLKSSEQVFTHYLYGNLFENMVVSDLYKSYTNQGKDPSLYFLRDEAGHEADLIFQDELGLNIAEIKASQTIRPDYMKNVEYWAKQDLGTSNKILIYGGKEDQTRTNFTVKSWLSGKTEKS
jgi:uncharacterized protein